MPGTDLRALARRMAARTAECPTVPPLRSGTAGHLAGNAVFLPVSTVPPHPSGTHEAGQSGNGASHPSHPAGTGAGHTGQGQPEPVTLAAAHLSTMVRAHGPDHPEAREAAHALLAACQGIADDPEERRCEPAWAEVSAEPPPGAWCAWCGRKDKSGGR